MAVPPLRALVAAGHDVVLVVTRDDKRRGRNAEPTPNAVKSAALEMGLHVSHSLDDVPGCGAELGVVVAYGRIIPPHVLEAVPMVNLHFSLLPRWRGAAPVQRAILAGDTETGVCVMQVAEGLDTGDVYDVVRVPVAPRATAAELSAELVRVGTEQIVRVLAAPLPIPVPQHGEPVHAAKITPADLRIDWHASAEHVDRLVRVGGAWAEFRGRRVKVLAAEPGRDASGAVPISGLRLVTVQPEGKPPMAFDDFVRGVRPQPGETLE
jgi:methionyl-tRNA formyltransferase